MNLTYEKFYITEEEDDIRDLMFVINNTENDLDFDYTYVIELDKFITQLNSYTWKLDYKKIYFPGDYADNWFVYVFKFENPDIFVTKVNSLSRGSISPLPSNEVNINFELSNFRTIDQISLTFEDIQLKREHNEKISFYLSQVFFVIFTIVLTFYYKYRLVTKSIILPAILGLGSELLSFISYFTSLPHYISPYYIPIVQLAIYLFIILFLIIKPAKEK